MFGNIKELGENGENVFAECLIEAIKNKYKITTKKTMQIGGLGFSKDFLKGRYGWPEVKKALRNDEFKVSRIDILVGDIELKLILDKDIPTKVSRETVLDNL